jgi:VWFA-related protein
VAKGLILNYRRSDTRVIGAKYEARHHKSGKHRVVALLLLCRVGRNEHCMKRVTVLVLPIMWVSAQSPTQDAVIRIDVNLVQLDAVVTDSKGKAIADLTKEDFEVLQDGKPQTITNFSFIRTRLSTDPTAPLHAMATEGGPKPAMALQTGDIRATGRILALVVDDLGLSFTSIAHVRSALKKFVDTAMQPGDLAVVIRTGAGMGSLQQFTSDKRLLYEAIDRVKYNALGRVGVGAFAPLGSENVGTGTMAGEQERQHVLSVGTMGAIHYIVEGLKELPGRKSVVLFSESMRIPFGNGSNPGIQESLKRITDAANRASVVIYSIDPRGLQYTGVTAADNTMFVSSEQIAGIARQRSQYLRDSRQGMRTLATETGGLFFQDTNDIDDILRKVLDDSNGYYLLAYHPDSATFDARKGQAQFHKVLVRMKRPGLTVRSRGGFIGVSDSEPRPVARTRQAEIAHALYSPFGAGALHARLTALFFNSPTAGSFISAMLYLDAKELKFEDDQDDWHKAVIDVVAMAFDGNGQTEERSDKTFTVRLKGDTYRQALKQGLIYSIHHAVKKPGAYHLRVAVRDAATHETGFASQFIEVPDVDKGMLALSGILMQADSQTSQASANTGLALNQLEGQMNDTDPRVGPAVRIFKSSTPIVYAYQILNAQSDSGKRPHVEAQVFLLKDGETVYEGQPTPLPSAKPQKDPRHLLGGGQLKLGVNTAPGDYVLQVIVTDKLASQKHRTATQSIDFEIEIFR